MLFTARAAREINSWLIPVFCGLITFRWHSDHSWIAASIISFFGTLLGNYPMDRTLCPSLGIKKWSHLVFSSLVIRFSSWAIYLAAAILMPNHWNWSVVPIVLGFLALQLGLQFGLGLRLIRALRLLRKPSARLQELVDETSGKLGVKVNATWEWASPEANAMAFVVTKELAFTEKLLEIAPDDELRAITAHELGHLLEGRWIVLGRLAEAYKFFPLIFMRPVQNEWGVMGIGLLGFAVLGLWIGPPRWLRSLERKADQVAQSQTTDEGTYARALERLYRSNQMPAVLRKSSLLTHPDLYDRMIAAGLTPDYPRPEAPSGQAWTSIITAVALMSAAMIILVRTFNL